VLNKNRCDAAPAVLARADNDHQRSLAQLVKRTLTNLYNQRPTWLDLAHKKLDEAVLAAYGWSPDMSHCTTAVVGRRASPVGEGYRQGLARQQVAATELRGGQQR
jgi:hypothetical protein